MKKNTAFATALGGLAISVSYGAVGGDLPVPAVTNWVGAGQATGTVTGNTFNINQASQNVSLNWQSFNIGRDSTVNFLQPDASSVALNRIFQADPVQIRGSLNANGEVYLLSQNGIIFGDTAQVNVRGLIASSLDITPSAEMLGLAPLGGSSEPAFTAALDANGNPVAGDIHVASGARITTPSGGRVFLFAPKVTNEGTIKTPDGQTALAAGNKVYLSSNDPSILGLVVEVGDGGVVTNGSTVTANTAGAATIQADHGNVSLVGLAVNQLGRVSASTAVRSGGSIRLVARESRLEGSVSVPQTGGTLTLGANSVTEANPDLADKELTLDANPQPPGNVTLVGNEIFLRSGSLVSAKSGSVTALASRSGAEEPPNAESSSRIYLESGSTIDVSGEFVDLPPERNALTVRLQGAELRDSPVQRDSALRGQLVTVDVRRRGTTADGRSWVGTPLADLNEAAQGVRRSVAERSTDGGTVSFKSEGDAIIAEGSSIDVSGGGLRYAGGALQTTLLVRDGVITNIGSADPNLAYDGVFGSAEKVYSRWGVVEQFQSAFVNGVGTGDAPGEYFEGKDAGALQLYGTRLILDGGLLGDVTRGEFQRMPTAAFTGAQRPGDQVPRGGQLTIGYAAGQDSISDFGLSSVSFGIQPVLPNIPAFDPLHDPMPGLPADVTIPVAMFGEDKFSSLTIFANGRLDLAAGLQLNLGPGGTLTSTTGEVNLAGQISARGGAVSMLTNLSVDSEHSGGRIRMEATADVDVSGLWTNDTRDPKQPPMPFDRLLVDAGSIRFEARELQEGSGGLFLEAGSRLDADGGASVSGARVTAGRGGSISLLTRRDQQVDPVGFVLEGDLSAYGLEQGGTMSIQASDVCIAVALCEGADGDTTAWFTPDYLRHAGFRSYSFVADGGGLTIPAGERLELQQVNRVLDAGFLERADRANLDDFSHLANLPDIQRKPVDLSLGVRIRTPDNTPVTDEILAGAGFLDVGSDAYIDADPGARIALSSDTRIFFDGTIDAPAGNISLSVESAISGSRFAEFMPSQSLWLGSHAALLAPGTSRIVEDGFGRRSGDVLAAGSVRVDARSGYLVAEGGSRIDVSGFSDQLDIMPTGGAGQAVAPVRTVVAADAGSITLKAAEGMLLAAELDGSAAGAGARAGSLTVEMNAAERNDDSNTQGVTAESLGISETARTLVISRENMDDAIEDLAPGEAIDARHNSLGYLDPDRVNDGAFGDVTLRAVNFQRSDQPAAGHIRFDGDVSLGASRRLVLDAAGIESNGGSASVLAPYVAIGNQDVRQVTGVTAVPDFVTRFGRLDVTADFIDIVGASRLLGIGTATFNSSGDIRLRGSQIVGRTDISGRLESTGNMTFNARQVYAPTLNSFTVGVRDNEQGRIEIHAQGTPTPLLSAGSHLGFEAADILQAGVVKAPLGAIVFDAAHELTLAPASITSTSLESQLVPFGRVEVGTDWVYGLDALGANGQRLVFTEQTNRVADPLPHQEVQLHAPSVTLAAGAVVDQSGGGDLLGYEFQSGLTGSFDVLDATQAPRNYAIVPYLKASYAPIDPQESLKFGLKPGESLELVSGIDGLRAGRYALLPARYALLPGAYLVSAVNGYADLAPGAVLPYAQGGVVLAGRSVFADGSQGDARTSGFVLRTPTDIAKLARYDLYRANTFATGFNGAPLPRDAGSTRIEAGLQLELGGSIRAAGVDGGRGATVEITGDHLAVVADRENNDADEGALLLEDGGLNSLHAASLILGGTRSFDQDGATLDVTAQQVEVDHGASLTGPEIIIAATGSVRIAPDARISGDGTEGADPAPLTVHGDGALLRVSSGAQTDFVRDGASGAAGQLDIAAGATIGATGSALLSGSQDVHLEGALDMNGGSLAVDASRINLGAPAADDSGFTLDAADFGSLHVDELRLAGRNGIDVYQPLDVSLKRLEIRAPTIVGHLDEDQMAHFVADEFSYSNPDFAAAPAPEPPHAGSLDIEARNVSLGVGDYAIQGFSSVKLAAQDNLLAAAKSADATDDPTRGSLSVGSDLELVAGRISGQDNADLSIEAIGAVKIGNSGATATVPVKPDLEARLSIRGESLVDAGRVDLGSGALELRATGDLTITDGATINVAGSVEHFGDQAVFAPAGGVRLQSDHGNVSLQAGSIVDVSGAAAGGDAGRLDIAAVQGSANLAGTMRGSGGASANAASFGLDVKTLDDFSTLNAALANAGFNGELELRARSGNIEVPAGDRVTARSFNLTADDGDIEVAGQVNVSGPKAGSIGINAGGALSLSAGAALTASSTGPGNRGGEVSLRSTAGAVLVEAGSSIDVSAAAGGQTAAAAAADRGGRVNIRVTRAAAATLTDGDAGNDQLRIDGDVSGARRVDVEAYQRYAESDGSLDSSEVGAGGNPLFDDAATFIDTQGAGIRAALGNQNGVELHLRPGIEIVPDEQAPDLRLTDTWDLSQWRFGGESGVLTIRSAGNLDFDSSLSDGFDGVADLSSNALPVLRTDDSWSYRLVAGADLASANLLAVRADSTGSVSLAPGTPGAGTLRPRPVAVRTGTGSIDLAAAGDVTLGNRASVIYTAGRDTGEGIRLTGGRGSLENRPYPLQGGDISVSAGGSVRGVAPDQRGYLSAFGNQLITPWLYRQGASDVAATGVARRATGWTVAYERFEQGIGALGGGNIAVEAGGELDNLSLSVPSIGMQVGGTTADASEVRVVGGGDIDVHAQGDIAGGVYFVGKGDANLITDGSVRSGRVNSESENVPVHTILALGDGTISIGARGRLDLETVVNPTLLPQSAQQRNVIASRNSFFSTYGDQSLLRLASLSGDVELFNDNFAVAASRMFGVDFVSGLNGHEENGLVVYPPRLEVTSLRGDVVIGNSMSLYPSSASDVQLLADGNIHFGGNFSLSDADPAQLGTATHPNSSYLGFDVLEPGARIFAPTPVHAGVPNLGAASFTARQGDIDMTVPIALVLVGKSAQFSAGRDIRNLNALIQNLGEHDVSVLDAGRDLVYSSLRDPQGLIIPSSSGIDIQGPGKLLVEAGRDIDLGASRGISSLGDTANPGLADQGADVIVIGGLNGHAPALDAFATKYEVDADLATVLDKFYGILRASGRRNAPLPNDQRSYADAFDAIKTLFPASDYLGSMDMFFSRIYTLDGGDIDLLMPGGGVNVGLAAPPSSFGVKKEASDLGLVAQGFGTVRAFLDQDFEVNESRVFAADGGDILVWSSNGDIDAGRGAKTSISAPPPIINVNPETGAVSVSFPPALTGSGIRTLTSTPGRPFGSVDLITPRGVVDASEAGIETLGNLTIAAVEVLGTQNIKVGGVSTGVPVDTGGLAASLSNVSSVGSAATAATADVSSAAEKSQAPIADSAMSFLEVFVLGFGEGVCDSKDVECLKRQQSQGHPQ